MSYKFSFEACQTRSCLQEELCTLRGMKSENKVKFKLLIKRDVNLMSKYGGEGVKQFFVIESKLMCEGGEILSNW